MFRINGPISPDCSCDEGDVQTLKHKLIELGYLADGELSRTGIPDEAMFKALESFQDDQGIEEIDL